MAVRYIGSKARLVDVLLRHIGAPTPRGTFVEPFCGTGVVAEAAARLGWPVRINDHLRSAVVMASSRLQTAQEAPFHEFGGYTNALALLNSLPQREGFMWREYSPASRLHVGVERRYFTEANAAKIDAVRRHLLDWSSEKLISWQEENVLISDLMAAANRVANIAGTYGCFMREWLPQARCELVIAPRTFLEQSVRVESSVGDARQTQCAPHDVVYLDPPYTKRQYAAYYHILETIAIGDEPVVTGITGLRPWQELASDYCYKTRALGALCDLVESCPSQRILLSYSSEGHVPIGPLSAGLQEFGNVQVHSLMPVARYRPNQAASDAGVEVTEYLIEVRKSAGVQPIQVAA
jgi:adenine-specific DNA-methyltransferase